MEDSSSRVRADAAEDPDTGVDSSWPHDGESASGRVLVGRGRIDAGPRASFGPHAGRASRVASLVAHRLAGEACAARANRGLTSGG